MSDKSVNFKALVEQMQRAREDAAAHPTILGGQFTPDRLQDFLAVWRERWTAMNFRIWEHISHIEFADEPAEPAYLQRAEIFGEGGHLSLRQDSHRWRWHYIGPAGQPLPNGFDKAPECENFWIANSATVLRRYEDRAILWGERKKDHDFWWEDRVAAARLVYPKQREGRVYLDFWRYTQDGQTVFVWYRQLVSIPSED
jgi:hypothetical protein